MNPDHDYFCEWDAAYVVGALSPAERRQFEDHLVECDECRRAVGELAPTVGLLSRISMERAVSIDAEPAASMDAEPGDDAGLHVRPTAAHLPDPAMRAAVVSTVRRRARRRRAVWWTTAAAAILVVVAAIAIPMTITQVAPTQTFALEAVVDAPLEASVSLDSVAWGTRIDLECRYGTNKGADAPEGGWPYALTVVGDDGTTTTVSTWRALPQSTARLSAGTALDVGHIIAIEIRSITPDRLVMRYAFEPPAIG